MTRPRLPCLGHEPLDEVRLVEGGGVAELTVVPEQPAHRALVVADDVGGEPAGEGQQLPVRHEEIEAAIPAVRARIAFYASTPAYRDLFELHGWGAASEELTALSKAGRWKDMGALISDEMVDAFAIVSRPDDLPAQVAERFGGILTRISFVPPAGLGREAAADLVERLRRCC